ncbi:sigma-70 family RNA polymerase sigma factor [Leptospira interrogans]|uniref:sigma-70 family RNA polymerase sigma factor n=1 Tax=Leptospira interrogans TaxID=173 RepID=UPI003CF6687B
MQQKTELDCIFINSYLKYKNLGDSKDLIEQAAFWIGRIAVRKYSLSEDERSEVLLKFIQKIEYFSKIYETGKFENFSAFAIVFLKHLVLNQWKKKINSLKRKPIFLEPDSLPGSVVYEPDYDCEPSPHKIFLQGILQNLDPRGVLIFKLKHNLFLERKDILLLKSILASSRNSIRDFLKERAERTSFVRCKEIMILEKMEISHQLLFSNRKDAANFSSQKKRKLRKKLLRAEVIYTYEEISNWFDWKSSVIKRLYLQTMNSLKNSGKDSEFNFKRK